jgi:hypothetical protein
MVEHLPSKSEALSSNQKKKNPETIFFLSFSKQGVVVHACNPSIEETEAAGSRVKGSSGTGLWCLTPVILAT